MIRALTLHDVILAAAAMAAGIAAGLLSRVALRWLGVRAQSTRWSGDDIIVDALRTLVPWASLTAGAAAAVGVLPLSGTIRNTVHQVLLAGLILVATVTAARVATDLVRSLALARSGVAGSATIFINITRVAVLAMGILVLLQTLGVSVAPLLTALGVGGLAVALALQDTLANLFAGVHILASRTVQPGDYIRLSSGEEGYVVDINWRNTVVRQLPNNLVIIPNAQLAGTITTNFHQPVRQMSLTVLAKVGYGADLELVEAVTNEVAAKVMAEVDGGVPDFEPSIRFHTFGESSIDFSVNLEACEFSDQYLIKHEFIKQLHQRFQAEGIEVPFPKRTVVLHHQDEEQPSRGRRTTADTGLPPKAVLPLQKTDEPPSGGNATLVH
ncbi:mechanosensitive ion channel family protein [Streptomyces sp. NPDC001922]|uniref:mechanosensitive ion channel family protein n=1 Tax=Streptomyces sp. NPDC001922 TaxID=3364624 RepID=UPI003689D5F2